MMDDGNRDLPADFFFTSAEAVAYWADPLDAALLEALPGTPIFEGFAAIARDNEIVNRVWGQPDLAALRRMTGAFREEFAHALGVTEDIVEAYEYGLVPMRLRDVLALCRYFNWPISTLFRSGYGEHRFTQLVAAFGIPL